MDYKKYQYTNYNIHLINTDRFKQVMVNFNFTLKYNKDNINKSLLLSKLLTNSCKKYKTKREIDAKLEDMYLSALSSSVNRYGNLLNFELSIKYIESKYINKNIDEENIDFLLNLLLHPNIINNKFKEEEFLYCKNNIKENLLSIKDNSYLYGLVNFSEIFHKENMTKYSIFGDYNKIDKLDNETLYQFYLKLLNECKLDIIIVGNANENIIKYFDSLNKLNNKYKNINYKINTVVKDNVKVLSEKNSANQSHLYVGFKTINLTEFEEKYVVLVFNMIFGKSEDNLLFSNVRTNKNLCYTINSNYNRLENSIIVYAGINKKNYNNCLKEIKDSFEMMFDEKILTKFLYKTLKSSEISYNYFYDNIDFISEHYFLKETINVDPISKQRDFIKKVMIEDLMNLKNKIKLDTIFLLEGNNFNEENNL